MSDETPYGDWSPYEQCVRRWLCDLSTQWELFNFDALETYTSAEIQALDRVIIAGMAEVELYIVVRTNEGVNVAWRLSISGDCGGEIRALIAEYLKGQGLTAVLGAPKRMLYRIRLTATGEEAQKDLLRDWGGNALCRYGVLHMIAGDRDGQGGGVVAPGVVEVLEVHKGAPKAPAAAVPTVQQKGGGKGVSVEQAKALGEAHCRRNPFPGVKALAKIVGCSSSTMSKAISQSRQLRTALAEQKAKPKNVPTAGLNEMTLDRTQQTRELDPSAAAAETTDTVFCRLIEEATPEERAKLHAMTPEERARLNAMTPDERLQLMAIVGNDPDKEEQEKRHRSKKGRSR